MLYRKTLPHHGRTFYGSLQLSRLFQKMHAFGGRCFLVFLVSVLGVCVSVYYHFTPGIPFDRNLFAALGMIPGAFLLLLPCGAGSLGCSTRSCAPLLHRYFVISEEWI